MIHERLKKTAESLQGMVSSDGGEVRRLSLAVNNLLALADWAENLENHKNHKEASHVA